MISIQGTGKCREKMDIAMFDLTGLTENFGQNVDDLQLQVSGRDNKVSEDLKHASGSSQWSFLICLRILE